MKTEPILIKIPEKRVAVLIGTGGKTKKMLEKEFKCRLKVSSEGDVEIRSKSPLKLLDAKEAVTAIARGFSPEHALLLKDEENILELLCLSDYLGERDKALIRFRSRIIGAKGKVRENIEELTKTNISVYGKTVGIIGKPEDVKNARNSIEIILSGRAHRTTYAFLRRKAKNEDF